ncbi:MAG: 50S ribosomal protein L22 [bacterium]|nr:50S ribosomal protein L22 [bacterium]
MAQEKQERPVKDKLLAQIMALNEADDKKVIKTRARRTKIRKEFVGHTLAVFNGQDYTRVHITSEMEGRTLAKVAPRISPTAQAKFLSIPPRKMRQVASLIKGLPAEKALGILNFTPKIAAEHMARTLKAAVANVLSVEGTDSLNPEDLHVKQIVVSAGPIAKRIQYRSMGRVYRIRKRYCHLAIYLAEKSDTAKAVVTQSEPTKAAKSTKTDKPATKAKKAKSAAKPAAKKTAKKTTAKAGTKKTATKTTTTAKKTAKASKPKADTKKK